MARIIVIGSQGMLGRALCNTLQSQNQSFAAPPLSALDITNADSIASSVTDDTQLILNAAAWTDVDGAETHESEATRVNGDAVGLLAARAEQLGATLVHYSTDYVFNGHASSPYPVDAPRAPLNAYGRSKLAGELALEASAARFFLLRTSWLYAPWGKNFVRTMASLTQTRDSLRVVDDQHGRPTSAEWLAEATFKLLATADPGTYHVSDSGQCSWYQLTQAISDLLGHRCTIHPCSSAEFPRPAPRPAYSVLDLSGTERAIGAIPTWHANLQRTLQNLAPLP